MPHRIPGQLAAALDHHRAGRLSAARALYEAVLAIAPEQADALNLLGVLRGAEGASAEGIVLLRRAVTAAPGLAAAWSNLGVLLAGTGDWPGARAAQALAVALQPDEPGFRRNLALAQLELGEPAEALANLDAALPAAPADLALPAVPADPALLAARARALAALGRPSEAVAALDALLAATPLEAGAWVRRGVLLQGLGRPAEAVASHGRALAVRPGFRPALLQRALTLLALGDPAGAAADAEAVLAQAPDEALALNTLANARLVQRRFPEAAATFDRLRAAVSDYPYALSRGFYARLQGCDWVGHDALRKAVQEAVAMGRPSAEIPFALLAHADDPALHLACARAFVAERCPPSDRPLCAPGRLATPPGDRRIRLAYVSADFREHPGMVLMAGLFERHDRARFEVTAISLRPPDPSPLGRRVQAAFERFVDVSALSDRAAAERIHALGIDIAVNRSGYTTDSRSPIFAERPAPIQVGYLGYPGTSGAPYMDYIIADRHVIGPDNRAGFTEAVVTLPHSYQANDDRRPIAAGTPGRAALGLPADGFVFCCFNNNHKITPEVFGLWLRLLAQIPGSVLWLLADNPAASANLRRAAAAGGIDPARLVFAGRVPLAEHLARHRCADLFLDTLPYNAHTTASDALWAGLPVLTRRGRSFAARVGASLLLTLGLPELVTESAADYETLALRLARDPALLGGLRARLAAARGTAPLFATDRTRQALEAAFAAMVERARRGLPPADLALREG